MIDAVLHVFLDLSKVYLLHSRYHPLMVYTMIPTMNFTLVSWNKKTISWKVIAFCCHTDNPRRTHAYGRLHHAKTCFFRRLRSRSPPYQSEYAPTKSGPRHSPCQDPFRHPFSRQAGPLASRAAPVQQTPHRYRTGRTAQFNTRIMPAAFDRFYQIADQQGWKIGKRSRRRWRRWRRSWGRGDSSESRACTLCLLAITGTDRSTGKT